MDGDSTMNYNSNANIVNGQKPILDNVHVTKLLNGSYVHKSLHTRLYSGLIVISTATSVALSNPAPIYTVVQTSVTHIHAASYQRLTNIT